MIILYKYQRIPRNTKGPSRYFRVFAKNRYVRFLKRSLWRPLEICYKNNTITLLTAYNDIVFPFFQSTTTWVVCRGLDHTFLYVVLVIKNPWGHPSEGLWHRTMFNQAKIIYFNISQNLKSFRQPEYNIIVDYFVIQIYIIYKNKAFV